MASFKVTMQLTNDLFEKEISKEKFMGKNPTLVGSVAGVSFYEHPIYGDDVALIAVKGEKCGYSHWYDLPTLEEIAA